MEGVLDLHSRNMMVLLFHSTVISTNLCLVKARHWAFAHNNNRNNRNNQCFVPLGFTRVRYPEIERDYFAFEALKHA